MLKRTAFPSRTLWKKAAKFATHDKEIQQHVISAPLIGQLAKNASLDRPLISGDELLQMACDDVAIAQSILGGKMIYLECENKAKLLEFYHRNGFKEFGARQLEADERSLFVGTELIQLLKIL